jgi:GNAT superfamily N-acetyltransferase
MARAPDHLVEVGLRWTPAKILRRAHVVIRQQGASALFFKVLGELGYRRVLIYKEVLRRDLDPAPSSLKFDVRTLSQDEVPVILELTPNSDPMAIGARFAAGHICHSAWSGDALVGFIWSAPRRATIEYLNIGVVLPAGSVYTYEIFVKPEYRRTGVAASMISERRRQLLEVGYHTGYSAVMPENTAGVHTHRKMEVLAIGTMTVIWCGPWQRAWLRMTDSIEPLPLGIES